MASTSEFNHLHFVLIPLMSPGHLIPMADMARLLAAHGVVVTLVTTPLNAIKLSSTVARAVDSGLKIQLLQLQFPTAEAGLPDGCESMDILNSRALIRNFYQAAGMLQQPFEEVFETLQPWPSSIISGKNLPWTVKTAKKYGIPRFFFDAMGCFSFCCTHNIEISKVHENVSRFDPFVVPDLPHQIVLTRAMLPESLSPGAPDLTDVRDNIKAVEGIADGIIVNTFEELETEYVKEYKKVKGENIWCVGPVSACNKMESDKIERGQKGSTDEHECLKWLDLQEPGSVVYACLGSICGLTSSQLMEVGLGLEASNHPFIWVIRGSEKTQQLVKWIEVEKFEERTKRKGLLIKGWSPQVLILSHRAIGGFLTHCGWNSTIEGVSSGVPILACPLFAEQFLNEKLVVEVLRIGVSVGVEEAVTWGLEEKAGLVIKREKVEKAIVRIMEKGEEGDERRKRAKEIGEIARKSIEEGGSSYFNMELLIQFVSNATNN